MVSVRFAHVRIQEAGGWSACLGSGVFRSEHLVKILTKHDEKLKMAQMGKCYTPLARAMLLRTLDCAGNCTF